MQDCIEWQQSCQRSGYGQTWDGKTVVYAHRVAYEREHGPIPEGMTVHHRCNNRKCVNVEHMELLRRDDHSGALGHGKLTREEGEQIRALALAGWEHQWIADTYGVSNGSVSMIKNGHRWKVEGVGPTPRPTGFCRSCGRELLRGAPLMQHERRCVRLAVAA